MFALLTIPFGAGLNTKLLAKRAATAEPTRTGIRPTTSRVAP